MRRFIKRLAILLAVAVALLLGFALILSRFVPEVEGTEVARVRSPDGKLEAIVRETNGGATTSFGYEVAITQVGKNEAPKEVAYIYDALRSSSAYGVNARWTSEGSLQVEYLKARTAKVLNANPQIGARKIEVTLQPGIEDAAAPSGGMLYNARGRR